jgi:hypothetical protein
MNGSTGMNGKRAGAGSGANRNLKADVLARVDLPGLVSRYGVKLSRANKGRCPFHNDQGNPNFTVYNVGQGWRFKCHRCDAQGNAIDFVMRADNLSFTEARDKLAADVGLLGTSHGNGNGHKNGNGNGHKNGNGNGHKNGNGNGHPTTSPASPPPGAKGKRGFYGWDERLTATYVYANGFVKERIDFINDEGEPDKTYPWYTAEGYERHRKGLGGATMGQVPLYRLPELLRADPSEGVLLVEGEKACDALREQGFVAVSLPGGAKQGNFGKSLEALRGRKVLLWPDKDEPGEELMQRVGASLLGIASEVRMLRPGSFSVEPKDDAFDFFARGGRAEGLRLMMGQAETFVPNPDPDPLSKSGSGTGTGSVVWLNEQPEPGPRDFIIEGWIPANFVTSLYGDGGLGKSYLALMLASYIARGLDWNGRKVKQMKVLYIDAELDAEEVTRRAYEVARGMGYEQPALMGYLGLEGRSIVDPVVQAGITALVKEQGFNIILLDSLTMATYTADAKSSSDMIAAVKFLEGLCTSLVIDHIRGTPSDANQSLYSEFGSAFKRFTLRSSIQVVKALGGGLALIHKKANFGPKQDNVNVVMSFEGNAVNFRYVAVSDEAMAGIESNLPAVEQTFTALAGCGAAGEDTDVLAASLGLTEKTVRNHMTALKKAGRVEPKGGKRWVALGILWQQGE